MGPQSRTRTTALALILALSFAAGGAQASTREHSARLKALESQGVIEVLWSWISPFLPSGDGSAAPAQIHSVAEPRQRTPTGRAPARVQEEKRTAGQPRS